MDINKIKQYQDKLNDESIRDLMENIPPSFINFSNSPTVNESLQNIKTGIKINQSSRVINNWISQGIIKIDENDKGKINRFNKIESIWINIINETRKFGFPIESLKKTRNELFSEPVPNFSLLKFHILDSILRTPKTLIISEEGHTNILSREIYTKWLLKGLLVNHLSFNLIESIIPEFPLNAFNQEFGFDEPYSDINKCKFLYYLKTGDYKFIKLYMDNDDIRLIENPTGLIGNTNLHEVIKTWNFKKAVVTTVNDREDIITCNQ